MEYLTIVIIFGYLIALLIIGLLAAKKIDTDRC